MVEPSGTFFGYLGCAVGKAKQNAKTEIEKLKTETMTCAEAVKEVRKIKTGLIPLDIDGY